MTRIREEEEESCNMFWCFRNLSSLLYGSPSARPQRERGSVCGPFDCENGKSDTTCTR